MEKEDIKLARDKQRNFFNSGKTFDTNFRIDMLKKIRSRVILHEAEIRDALWKDFHKPAFEVIATETGFIMKEINLAMRQLKKWSRPKKVRTPVVHFLAWSYIRPQPYGQVFVLSPWNYPFQMAFLPMIGALAAGHCVVLKVSRQVPHSTAVMEKILAGIPQELVLMISGDHS